MHKAIIISENERKEVNLMDNTNYMTLLRTGKVIDGNGKEIEFNENHFDSIISKFNRDELIPVKIGHNDSTYAKGFVHSLKKVGNELKCSFFKLRDEVIEKIKDKYLSSLSAEINLIGNEAKLTAVAMLGTQKPAIANSITLSEKDENIYYFNEYPIEFDKEDKYMDKKENNKEKLYKFEFEKVEDVVNNNNKDDDLLNEKEKELNEIKLNLEHERKERIKTESIAFTEKLMMENYILPKNKENIIKFMQSLDNEQREKFEYIMLNQPKHSIGIKKELTKENNINYQFSNNIDKELYILEQKANESKKPLYQLMREEAGIRS